MNGKFGRETMLILNFIRAADEWYTCLRIEGLIPTQVTSPSQVRHGGHLNDSTLLQPQVHLGNCAYLHVLCLRFR